MKVEIIITLVYERSIPMTTFEERLLKSLRSQSKKLDWSLEKVEVKDKTVNVVVAKDLDTQDQVGVAIGEHPEKLSKRILVNTILASVKGQINKTLSKAIEKESKSRE